jgi:diguanylate cyclase (GGDEF)-like protein/PAS domain S-box-containing protein
MGAAQTFAESDLAAGIAAIDRVPGFVGSGLALWAVSVAFRNAVIESLECGAPVMLAPEALLSPEQSAQSSSICSTLFSEDPISFEVGLPGGQTLEISVETCDDGSNPGSVSVLAHNITARKRRERAQLNAAQRQRHFFDTALTGMFQTTLDGIPIAANLTLARMLGYESAGEMVSHLKAGISCVWADARDRIRLIEELKEHETCLGRECQFRRKDGSLIWVMLSVRLVPNEIGEPHCLEGFIEDITGRKLAEIQLRDSEERYRASFDQAAVGILHTSLQGRILKCNESFARIVGYSPEELVGSDFQSITPAEDRDSGKAVAISLLSGKVKTASFEKRYVRKDGRMTWVMLTISIQHDSEGHALFFLTLVQDINARKRAEESLAAAQEALRVSEDRYRTAFQMSLDSISLNRLNDGLYVDCNKAFFDITGYNHDEVIGQTSIELNIWADVCDREKMVDIVRRQGACRNLEARFRKKNGGTFWGLVSASVINLDGVPHILSINRDISDAKSAEEEIRYLAFYDPLTELPNRRMLLERLRQAVNSSRRSGRERALLFVDLDNFKTLNETLGHHIGDLLLKEVGKRLAGCIRAVDTAARVGGDEFVVILEELSELPEEAASQAKAVAEKILACINQPYLLAEHECLSTSSIGITVFSDASLDINEILQQADIAMYQAKAAGRDAIRFFAPELQAAVNARAALEDEIRQGIQNQQFLLWYQPQIDGGRVIGAEALLRWNHPQRGILAPCEFISQAEETGLILPLGKQVLESACAQLAAWANCSLTSSLSIAVNVSARQFRQVDFVEQVLSVLKSTGANPHRLKLEITESMLLDNFEETIAIMVALKAHGVQFSLDDFGTGYSSLTYLKRLPLDQLKIDRCFVRDMLADPTSSAIARAIVSLSRAMGLSLLAEGVETEEQRLCLDRLGCHAFQGYLFSRPVPIEKFQLFLRGISAVAEVAHLQDTHSS